MTERMLLKVGGGFAYIAIWQALIFFLLILMVWVNEILDFGALLFGRPKVAMDVTRGCLATAGMLLGGIVTVGNTYLQQRRIVQGMLTICAYCKKIRLESRAWQQIEEYIGRRSPVSFSHGICPECLTREKAALDKH